MSEHHALSYSVSPMDPGPNSCQFVVGEKISTAVFANYDGQVLTLRRLFRHSSVTH